MSVASEVHAELRRLRQRVPAVTGTLVATMDGLLIAQDLTGVEPEGVAALTAAGLGLGQRIAGTVRQGDLQEVLVRNAGGLVGTYAAGPRVLLTVIAPPSTSLERLNVEARQAAGRVAAIIEVLDVLDFGDLDPAASTVVQPSDGYGVGAAPVVDSPGLPQRRPRG